MQFFGNFHYAFEIHFGRFRGIPRNDKYREYFSRGQLHPDVQLGMREAAADPTPVKQLHINALPVTAAMATSSVYSMYWYLLPTQSEEPLITSENPVISVVGAIQPTEHGHLSALAMALGYIDWHYSRGNLNPSLRVLTPLSPELTLLIAPTTNLPIRLGESSFGPIAPHSL